MRIKLLQAAMAGLSDDARRRFYADNFVDLMGAGLPDAIRH